MEVSCQLEARAGLLPGKQTSDVPIGEETGWAPESVWTLWRRERLLHLRESNPDSSAVQPVAHR
jgi:hypothetical protein